MAQKPKTSRLNQRVSGAASRLDDHKILLGVLVAIVGAFLAYIAFVSTTGPPFQSKYQVQVEVPADAPPLRVGQAVRIGGKLAGLISAVEPDRENGGSLVTANITKTEFRPIGKDATARVTVHSIVYATYLELYPGDTDDPMPDGGTIVQADVDSGVDLLEVVQLFDEEARTSIRKSVVNLGFGMAGRGEGLNQAFADRRADRGQPQRPARCHQLGPGRRRRGAGRGGRDQRGSRGSAQGRRRGPDLLGCRGRHGDRQPPDRAR